MLITILATVTVLGVLILVHELGHFVTAKMVDIEVPRFSIGLGPKMIGFTRGETEYVISWIPLGGYVKMAGMEELEKLEGGPAAKPTVTGTLTADDLGVEVETAAQAGPRDFESKSLAARTLVISAGVIMNLLFAVLIFAAIAVIWGIPVNPEARIGSVAEEYLPPGTEGLASLPMGTRIVSFGNEPIETMRDLATAIAKAGPGPIDMRFENHPPVRVEVPAVDSSKANLIHSFDPLSNAQPIIGRVGADQPAAAAGLRAGDRVLTADDQPIKTWQQFVAHVEARPGQPIKLEVDRGGTTITTMVTPRAENLRGKTTYGRLGISAGETTQSALPRDRAGVFGAIEYGFVQTWDVVALTVDFLRDLFTGAASPRNVGEIGRAHV